MWHDRREMTTRMKLAFLGVSFIVGLVLVALFGRH
jgi:hypothetical protein